MDPQSGAHAQARQLSAAVPAALPNSTETHRGQVKAGTQGQTVGSVGDTEL